MTHSRSLLALFFLSLTGLIIFPIFGDEFYQELVIRLMIMGIFAMSLDLLIGYTGLVSFGHAAFFGLSGYMLAIITPETEPVSIWLALPFCLLVTAVAALIIGWFSVRTSGIYFIMITLAFAQMFYYYFNENQALGGSDGIFIFYKPAIFFGDLDRIFVGVLQLMFLVGMILVGQSANLGGWFLSSIGIAAILFLYQQYLIRNRDSLCCFIAFKNNATLGLFVLTGIVLDYLFVS